VILGRVRRIEVADEHADRNIQLTQRDQQLAPRLGPRVALPILQDGLDRGKLGLLLGDQRQPRIEGPHRERDAPLGLGEVPFHGREGLHTVDQGLDRAKNAHRRHEDGRIAETFQRQEDLFRIDHLRLRLREGDR